MGRNKGPGAYPGELMHFAIADRWPGSSPDAILNEWDEELYEEAVHVISAEARWRKSHPKG